MNRPWQAMERFVEHSERTGQPTYRIPGRRCDGAVFLRRFFAKILGAAMAACLCAVSAPARVSVHV
jgi:hypothetical protein